MNTDGTNILYNLIESSIKLEFIEFSESSQSSEGLSHIKTCPWTIIAQSVIGSYEISMDKGSFKSTEAGGAFVAGANKLLEIIHHNDEITGTAMLYRFVHFHFTVFDTLDLMSFFEMPDILDRKQAKIFGDIINEFLSITRAPHHDNIMKFVKKRELGYKILFELYKISTIKVEELKTIQNCLLLREVLSYMQQNYNEDITIEHLARISSLSVSRFHALFKKHMKISPLNYLISLRLAQACRELAVTNKSIKEIASAAGYDDQFHFCKMFKTRYGLSPTAFREQHTYY